MMKNFNIYIFLFFIFLIFVIVLNKQNINLENNLISVYEYIKFLKDKNSFITTFSFITLSIIWVTFFGFYTPITILTVLFFKFELAILIMIFVTMVGSTNLYLISKYLLRDFFLKKFDKLYKKFTFKSEKNIFFFYIVFRFIPGIPVSVKNILSALLNIKLQMFLIATFITELVPISLNIFLFKGIIKNIDDIKNINFELLIDKAVLIPAIFIIIFIMFTKKFSEKYQFIKR